MFKEFSDIGEMIDEIMEHNMGVPEIGAVVRQKNETAEGNGYSMVWARFYVVVTSPRPDGTILRFKVGTGSAPAVITEEVEAEVKRAQELRGKVLETIYKHWTGGEWTGEPPFTIPQAEFTGA